MNCPQCNQELIFNSKQNQYYCKKERSYFIIDRTLNKLIFSRRYGY